MYEENLWLLFFPSIPNNIDHIQVKIPDAGIDLIACNVPLIKELFANGNCAKQDTFCLPVTNHQE